MQQNVNEKLTFNLLRCHYLLKRKRKRKRCKDNKFEIITKTHNLLKVFSFAEKADSGIFSQYLVILAKLKTNNLHVFWLLFICDLLLKNFLSFSARFSCLWDFVLKENWFQTKIASRQCPLVKGAGCFWEIYRQTFEKKILSVSLIDMEEWGIFSSRTANMGFV